MPYVVAYDIADPRRLARVARALERRAVRCQKSVFLFRGDAAAVAALLDTLTPLLDSEQDVVQAWKLSADESPLGLVRGSPARVCPAAVVLDAGRSLIVENQ